MTDDRRTAILNGYPVTPEYLARFEEAQQAHAYRIGEVDVPRIRYGSESPEWGFDLTIPCHDCRAVAGQFHYIGCDVEQCSLCGEQAMMCECADDDDD
jgi:hypothetical protein